MFPYLSETETLQKGELKADGVPEVCVRSGDNNFTHGCGVTKVTSLTQLSSKADQLLGQIPALL